MPKLHADLCAALEGSVGVEHELPIDHARVRLNNADAATEQLLAMCITMTVSVQEFESALRESHNLSALQILEKFNGM
jgi:hypothetical protein